MEIRPMTVQDLGAVLDIEHGSFRDPWSEEMFAAELDGPLSHCHVIDNNGDILGYTTCQIVLDEGHLMNIAVAPERRGEGLGRLLLEQLVGHCRKLGVTQLFLEVRKSNLVAIELYRSMGFEHLGIRRRYYSDQEDALVQRLAL